MHENTANPFIVALLFLVRCLVPLMLMLGVSYLLRRLGFIKEPPAPPEEPGYQDANLIDPAAPIPALTETMSKPGERPLS